MTHKGCNDAMPNLDEMTAVRNGRTADPARPMPPM